MSRRFAGGRLVIATHNAGKLREIGALLQGRADVLGAGALDLPEPEETADSFAGNAALKALAAARAANLPALADDSGLCVDALDGAPGILSARWAGPDRDFDRAMEKVWAALSMSDDKIARFVCALALAWPDGHVEGVEGTVEGQIIWPPRGSHGFGYDPIFQPTGRAITFGEMDPDSKHAISHRADAFARLLRRCF